MNEDTVNLTDRSAFIASKPAPTDFAFVLKPV